MRLGYLAKAEKLTVVLLKARNLKKVGKDHTKLSPGEVYFQAGWYDGLSVGLVIESLQIERSRNYVACGVAERIGVCIKTHVLNSNSLLRHVAYG